MKDNSEEILCGMMLYDNSIIPNVYDIIKPSAFNNPIFQRIYKTIYGLYNKGLSVDSATLFKELNGSVEVTLIAELTEQVPSSANFKYYAELVKSEYMVRGLKATMSRALEQIENGQCERPEDAKSVYSSVQGALTELVSNANSCHVYNMRDLVNKEIEIIDSYVNNKKEYLGLKTGFSELDDVLNGLQPVFMVLGARPSMGKTALLQKIAMNIAKTEKVCFIELEMSMQQLTERAISMGSKIPYRKLQSGMYTQAAMQKIENILKELTNLKNFVPIECFTRNLSDIANICRSQVRNNQVKAVFIDHVGLIRDDISGERNIYDKARFISNELQKLQRELNVPVVVASQLSRGSESKKSNENVGLDSIRGSGAYEEDADVCAFIIRDRATEENQQKIDTIVDVQKNRNGQVGKARLTFYPEIVNFEDSDKKIQGVYNIPVKEPAKKEEPKEEPKEKPEYYDNPDYDLF